MLVDPVRAGVWQCGHALFVATHALEIIDLNSIELGLGDNVVQLIHIFWPLGVGIVRWDQPAAVCRGLRLVCKSEFSALRGRRMSREFRTLRRETLRILLDVFL